MRRSFQIILVQESCNKVSKSLVPSPEKTSELVGDGAAFEGKRADKVGVLFL